MSTGTYLEWLLATKTEWWHDSADPPELRLGLERGAVGVTTNPFLSNVTMARNRAAWAAAVEAVRAGRPLGEPKAEALIRHVVTHAAALYLPHHRRSGGNGASSARRSTRSRAGDREAMLAMARRFHAWAPNIAVKLPAVAAGLDVLEDCVAEGITTTATVSFTVPQVIAVAERCRAGRQRAMQDGHRAGQCFAVIMIGRARRLSSRSGARTTAPPSAKPTSASPGWPSPSAPTGIYRERGYEAVLLVAALRGTYHLTELAGAELVMSIAPVRRSGSSPKTTLGRNASSARSSRRRATARFDAGVRQGLRAGRDDACGLHLVRRDAAHAVPVHRGRLEAARGIQIIALF